MIHLKVQYSGKEILEKDFPKGISGEEILTEIKTGHAVYACLFHNEPVRLNDPLEESGTLNLLDMTSSYGNMVYQTSLTLLYVKAVHDILGKDTEVIIANSLSKGLYTTIRTGSLTNETVKKIEERMRELVRADLPIEERTWDALTAKHWAARYGTPQEKALYETAPDLKGASVCKLEEEEDLFYLHAVPSTRYLSLFELRRYRNGVLLRFPHPEDPDVVPPYEEQKLLYDAFSEETHWESLLEIGYASELNRKVLDGSYKDMILLSEALHEKKIAEIAGEICRKKKRIILIAGPSSSGKTSFAKRLCIQLRVAGLNPLYLGTDDYFVDRKLLPVLPDGSQDFESLSAVDVKLFTSQMNDLLAGKEVDLPSFDFIKGVKVYGNRITRIEPSQPIVIEGIHGLNPALTKGIPEEAKFRIYISPLTQLNIDEHHRVPTTDARMLRRLVRDYRTRNKSAAGTIAMWPSVRRGEDHNIFPYNSEADVFFNSQCIYELAVLKRYAQPLLAAIPQSSPEYPEARRMLQFLDFFTAMPDDSIIPNNSILREFIGGSILVN
jgi:uridine kinase